MENEKVLEVDNLHVSFQTYAGEVKAVRGVSFELKKGETLAFVGESGCGKTVTAKAVMRLLKPPFAEIKPESKIVCNGKDVMKMTDKELYKFRGDEISMIFQDPMTSLNPTMTIGKQIMERKRCIQTSWKGTVIFQKGCSGHIPGSVCISGPTYDNRRDY